MFFVALMVNIILFCLLVNLFFAFFVAFGFNDDDFKNVAIFITCWC